MSTRRLARQAAMCLLYEKEINKQPDNNTLLEMKDVLQTEEFIGKHGDFVNNILGEYENHAEEVNALIEENCGEGWTSERLSRVDISILRLALTELMYLDTPVKVIVNEAVEIAKLYSTDGAASFVNGLLASVIRKTEKA